ncbi:ABC transporter substrate-binding protein [Methylobacterium soli]|uniref:ABC transporter substrate-binding protein n=1 Tax=Methylobacterium soli TaxID=553447 RepID=A0A6L3SXT5_9HYPH|nr:ABC transporter substrate-binding protein [Methylobacterium soli]KAB1077917.1 ABC transporter substrate-binding protein [Methylobacterium soli]
MRLPLRLLACLLILPLFLGAALAQDRPKLKLGFAKCAHCTPLVLLPNYVNAVEVIGFNTGNDVLTALVSKSIDVAQVTYLHYATALDKGFDVVAVSGQVNGGSQLLLANDLAVKEGDWAALKAMITERSKAGKPFRVAASRGNAQDIHMRGAFAKQGIDMRKDVEFINIPNPSDHAQALRRGEVDLICSVEPFATQIRQVGAGKFFDHPYDQPAGRLTNLMVTRSDVIAAERKAVQSVVAGIVKIDDHVAQDHDAWIAVITKVTGLDKPIAAAAIENLQPDYRMYRPQALAIAAMMRDLKYISKDVSAEVARNMDYSFLESATGKPRSELGD